MGANAERPRQQPRCLVFVLQSLHLVTRQCAIRDAQASFNGSRQDDTVKRVTVVLVLAFLAHFAWNDVGLADQLAPSHSSADAVLADAFETRQNNLQVKGQGKVVRILPDDNEGSRHQRFILELESGQTLLVAHNIDLAPRIPSLRIGDHVELYGEYEWNSRGGVIHWTHHDPQGKHVSGWLKHQGRTYK